MKELQGANDLEGNRHNPMASIFYSVSSLHSMTVSLAHDGAGIGIGTTFPGGLTRKSLSDAVFSGVDSHHAPGEPRAAVYVSRP